MGSIPTPATMNIGDTVRLAGSILIIGKVARIEYGKYYLYFTKWSERLNLDSNSLSVGWKAKDLLLCGNCDSCHLRFECYTINPL